MWMIAHALSAQAAEATEATEATEQNQTIPSVWGPDMEICFRHRMPSTRVPFRVFPNCYILKANREKF